MRLYLWIISRALGVEDRNVLDALHNHAHGLNIVNSKTLRELYALYDKAASEEMELQDKGVGQAVLAMTALQCLVNDTAYNDPIIAIEVHIDIDIIIKVSREMRSQFKIKK